MYYTLCGAEKTFVWFSGSAVHVFCLAENKAESLLTLFILPFVSSNKRFRTCFVAKTSLSQSKDYIKEIRLNTGSVDSDTIFVNFSHSCLRIYQNWKLEAVVRK